MKIPKDFGSGGRGINPGASNNPNSMAVALRDIADDLAACRAWMAAVAPQLTNAPTLPTLKTTKG